jgi:hypothetical protein
MLFADLQNPEVIGLGKFMDWKGVEDKIPVVSFF